AKAAAEVGELAKFGEVSKAGEVTEAARASQLGEAAELAPESEAIQASRRGIPADIDAIINERAAAPAPQRPASSPLEQALFGEHLRQHQGYGQATVREMADGRVRYYGEVTPAQKPGEMAGRRLAREWNPETGEKRTWHETVDHEGRIRQV